MDVTLNLHLQEDRGYTGLTVLLRVAGMRTSAAGGDGGATTGGPLSVVVEVAGAALVAETWVEVCGALFSARSGGDGKGSTGGAGAFWGGGGLARWTTDDGRTDGFLIAAAVVGPCRTGVGIDGNTVSEGRGEAGAWRGGGGGSRMANHVSPVASTSALHTTAIQVTPSHGGRRVAWLVSRAAAAAARRLLAASRPSTNAPADGHRSPGSLAVAF